MIAVVYVLLLSSSWATDIGDCHRLVAARQTQDHTDGFISLLQDLVERQIISATHLSRLVDSLEKHELANPILEKETWTSSSALIQYHAFQKYLRLGQLEQTKILDWAVATLNEMGQTRELKEAVREETKIPIYRMEFNPVEAKRFEMAVEGPKTRVTVDFNHKFEMMSTHVTENMWVELMGFNPAQYRTYPKHQGTGPTEKFVSVEVHGKLVNVRPNLPVDGISWLSAVEYANRLSILKGLKQAYDLSEVIFEEGTSAEAGNLRIKSGRVKINAPDEDIYKTEGYRLPTEAEYMFVLQKVDSSLQDLPFVSDERELEKYEWYSRNSGGHLHVVAELLPYNLDGFSFYDLRGNLSAWMHDFAANEVQGGINPQGPKYGQSHISKGRYFYGPSFVMNVHTRSYNEDPYTGMGFRLARTTRYDQPATTEHSPKLVDNLFQKIKRRLFK